MAGLPVRPCVQTKYHAPHVWEVNKTLYQCWGAPDGMTIREVTRPGSDPADLGVVQCPQESEHEAHRYTQAPGIPGEWWCPGVDNRRSGEDRRADAAYNHPQHYGGADNPYETIKVLCHWLTPEQVQGFTLGNAIKYISRAGKKDPAKTIEDLKKARWYLDYEITRLDVLGTEAALDNGG